MSSKIWSLVGLVEDGDVGLEVGDEDLGGDGAAPGCLVTRQITVH